VTKARGKDMVRKPAPREFLRQLKAEPAHEELESIRAMCSRYLDEDGLSSRDDDEDEEDDILPEGLTRDHFKDQEMVDRAKAWATEYDRVIAYHEAKAKGKKAAYPKGTPRFEGPNGLILYFKGKWENLKCRYC
jgi:hypothetical protein